MKVHELREALKDMPGEMSVYDINGLGIASVKHIYRGDLVAVTQFAEIRTYTDPDHTPQFEDAKIERYTGFKDRDGLIEAYLALKAKDAAPKEG